jgi:hypothetical protein
MFRAVLVTVGAAKLADRRFLILRRAIGVPALLAEHLPQVIVDTVVVNEARRSCVAWANTEVPSAGTPALIIYH